MDLPPLIYLVGWVEPPADLKPDSSPPLVVWKGGRPGNATASWLVWGHLGRAPRCSLLPTADTSESPTKCDMTNEKHAECSKTELNFSTKDFENFIMEKKDTLAMG